MSTPKGDLRSALWLLLLTGPRAAAAAASASRPHCTIKLLMGPKCLQQPLTAALLALCDPCCAQCDGHICCRVWQQHSVTALVPQGTGTGTGTRTGTVTVTGPGTGTETVTGTDPGTGTGPGTRAATGSGTRQLLVAELELGLISVLVLVVRLELGLLLVLVLGLGLELGLVLV